MAKHSGQLNKFLKTVFKDNDVGSYLAERGCSWTFNVEGIMAKHSGQLNKFLKTVFKDNDVGNYLAERGCSWTFNVEGAPWWGGAFERMV